MDGISEFLETAEFGNFTNSLRSWAEIDLAALRRNFAVAAESGRAVIAVVKADGYGHGASEIAVALEKESGLAAFGVATLVEAQTLRAAGITRPILILGTALKEERETLARERFWASISSLEEARAFDAIGGRIGQKIPLHLVVDTGMGRMGVCADHFDQTFAQMLAGLQNVEIIGLASHFPSADEDPDFTRKQSRRFQTAVETARAGGLAPRWVHLANSAGVLGFDEDITMSNAARPGLMLYGVSPQPEFQHRLHPVLTLKTRVTLIRDLPAGHGISYGRTFVTKQPTRVATLAIGYGDGVARHLSGQGAEILIGGTRCPLLGRVTMDQVMADLSQLGDEIQPGDVAVLIGKQGSEEITATELAEKAGTIPWEIFTSLTKRIPRLYQTPQKK